MPWCFSWFEHNSTGSDDAHPPAAFAPNHALLRPTESLVVRRPPSPFPPAATLRPLRLEAQTCGECYHCVACGPHNVFHERRRFSLDRSAFRRQSNRQPPGPHRAAPGGAEHSTGSAGLPPRRSRVEFHQARDCSRQGRDYTSQTSTPPSRGQRLVFSPRPCTRIRCIPLTLRSSPGPSSSASMNNLADRADRFGGTGYGPLAIFAKQHGNRD